MQRTLIYHLRQLALACSACLLAACASTPKPVVDYKTDYDFSKVHKIGFYSESGKVSGDNPMLLSDMQQTRINQALDAALQRRGLTVVDDPEQVDLLISWHLVTQHKTSARTSENISFGVGYGCCRPYNYYSMYSCWDCSPDVQVSNYTEGTFIVDMIDPVLKRSVWRGVIQSRLKGKAGTDQIDYKATADLVLDGFPPSAPTPSD